MERIDTKIGTFYVDRESDSNNLFTLLDENKKFICTFGDIYDVTKEERVEQLKNINHIYDLVELEFVVEMNYGRTPRECYDEVCRTVGELYDVDYEEHYPFDETKGFMNKVGDTYFVTGDTL